MGYRTFLVQPGGQSDRFNTAFYKFIELRGRSSIVANTCSLLSESEPGGERKTVKLWSSRALDDFAHFWRRFEAASRFERERLVNRDASEALLWLGH